MCKINFYVNVQMFYDVLYTDYLNVLTIKNNNEKANFISFNDSYKS